MSASDYQMQKQKQKSAEQISYEQQRTSQYQQQQNQYNTSNGLYQDFVGVSYINRPQGIGQKIENSNELPKPKQETNMISEISKDMRAFVKEHKSAIYWVAILMLCDHFFFHGAFKEKLKDMMNKMIGKVEDKIGKIEA